MRKLVAALVAASLLFGCGVGNVQPTGPSQDALSNLLEPDVSQQDGDMQAVNVRGSEPLAAVPGSPLAGNPMFNMGGLHR